VQREADLVEDVLRIYGYNNVEIPTQVRSTLSYAQKPDKNHLYNMVADMLTARGYTEIMSNSLTKAAYYENLECYKAENCVKILNPLSTDLNVMRQTLVFNSLEAVALNINHKNADLKLYEAGNCYYYNAEAATEENPLAAYSENYRLAITVTGGDAAPSWNCKSVSSSFFTLRATVELLLKRFGINIYDLKCESCDFDIFGDAICLTINKKPLVWMGQIAGKLCKSMGIKQEVFFAEIDFDTLIKATRKHKITVTELPKYPEVKRDLALLVDKSVTFATLRAIAFATERKLLKSVALFDVYEGDKLPEGKKSYALSFILEDKSQTLTDKAIERTMANLQAAFEKQAGATVR
jgi:phenylalanyl-tRNA synthetase beta chain